MAISDQASTTRRNLNIISAESGFENVVSPSGAAGFWQILKSTAKEYGLEVNSSIDERYNFTGTTSEMQRQFMEETSSRERNIQSELDSRPRGYMPSR